MKKDRYIVTGGAGFIGSHIVEELVARGKEVTVVDDLSTGKEENLNNVKNDIRFIKADIRNFNKMEKLCRECDYILHQAALRSVPRSVDDPVSTNEVNITGTLQLLLAAKESGIKKFVYASSSSVYGDTEELPKIETMRPMPISPYAVSKLTGEHYCRAIAKTFGLRTVSLRYFNVFGPRQSPESKYAAVVPIFIKQAMEGQPLTIHGDGKQSRDFTYVKNVANANILAAESDIGSGEVLNAACNNRYSVLDVADTVQEELGKKCEYEYLPSRAGDVRHTQADITLAEELIGYKVEVDFKQGMKKTVESFHA